MSKKTAREAYAAAASALTIQFGEKLNRPDPSERPAVNDPQEEGKEKHAQDPDD
jgi:hypothetical protein